MIRSNMSSETLTTFLRDPNSVIDRVEKGDDVILRRRDGEPLRLSLKSHWDERSTGTELVARLLVDLLEPKVTPALTQALLKSLRQHFTWLTFLSESQHREFLDDFLRTARACAEIGNNQPLAAMVSAWKSTAAIYADPKLAAELRRPLPGTDTVVTLADGSR